MKFVKLSSVVLFAILAVACGESSKPVIESSAVTRPPATVASAKPADTRVSVVLKSLTNPFFVEMAKGARLAQQESGIDLQIQTANPETSVEQQIRIVETLIKAHTAAIVISPVDTQRLIPVLNEARSAGIKIVNIDEQIDPQAIAAIGMKPVPYIGVDGRLAAYQAASYMAKQIKRRMDVAIMEGIPGTNTSISRKDGIQRAFEENKNIRIVATVAANWKAEDAYDQAKTLFKSHPKIGAVYCANDLMAIGIVKYLQEHQKNDVLVGGFDALDEAKKEIRLHQMLVTVDQRAARQGYIGVMSAIKLVRGEPLSDVVLVDTEMVTASSLK